MNNKQVAQECERLGAMVVDLQKQLSEANLAIAKAATWIPVSERLPDVHDKGAGELGSDIVLVNWPNGWIGLAEYWKEQGWWWVEQDDGAEADADPTHWMPLPEAPK